MDTTSYLSGVWLRGCSVVTGCFTPSFFVQTGAGTERQDVAQAQFDHLDQLETEGNPHV